MEYIRQMIMELQRRFGSQAPGGLWLDGCIFRSTPSLVSVILIFFFLRTMLAACFFNLINYFQNFLVFFICFSVIKDLVSNILGSVFDFFNDFSDIVSYDA